MKYLILRKRPGDRENPFTEMVAAGGGAADYQFPLEVTAAALQDRDVGDVRRDPLVEDVIPSIPFTLIQPLAEPADGVTAVGDSQVAWGIDAVGAGTCPLTGDGVIVAVLDTGIDSGHPAFAGRAFDPQDLRDFTTDEQGVAGSVPDVHGHGTHVAGTIFGREVNGTRIGVAPGVTRALIGKVLGGPTGGSTEAVFNAIDWASGAERMSSRCPLR